MLVFIKGSDWGENLFRDIFGSGEIHTDVYETVDVLPEDIVFDIENEGQLFDYGIIVKTTKINKKKPHQQPEQKKTKDISLPVVIKLFSKEIPLSEIDSIGETSQVLLSNSDQFDVELLVNGDIIGKGILKKEAENFKLKIVELYI
ncbi:hypothetical protein [Persephonella sp.]|uniref:hypothetical protein n=1 Tax=Persephonella sp. TaxID=2060922 RepID=UPI0025EFCAEA|nr:hypothetical protein [Persephonella sp.]